MAAAQGRTLRERSVLAEVPASAMIVALDGKPVGFVDIGKLLCGRTGTIAASSGFSPMIPNTAQLREASPECPITPLGNEVAFSASYDLAFGAMQALRDANGHPWAFVNDGLGRVTEMYDPLSLAGECTGSLESCAPSGLPVSKFQYEYGTPTRPISTTIIDKLVDRSAPETERYHRTYSYSDGAGRARQEKVQAEAELGGWVSSSWTDLSSRGAATKVYDTFKSTDSGFQLPPTGTPFTTSTLDALGRATVVRKADTTDVQGDSVLTGSRVLSVYEPFLTRAYTERESSIGDLEHPVVTRTDGLGRTILVEKSNTVRPAQSGDDIETAGSGERQELKWRIFYDVRGSIVNFADPKWGGDMSDVRHLRHYTYDGLGRLTKIQDPNAGETEYAFDALDRLVYRKDALSQEQRWEYGKAGRLTKHEVGEDNSGSPAYEHLYHYDRAAPGSPLTDATSANLWGQLSWLEFPTGEEHFAFDALGRSTEQVTRLWNPETSNFDGQERDTFRRQIDYRTDGQITEVRAPGGMVLRSEYNTRGGLRSLRGALGTDSARFIAQNIAYDHRGAEVSTLAGNQVQSCKRYNERAELTGFLAGVGVDCAQTGLGGAGFHHLAYERGHDALIDAIADKSAPSADTGIERLDAEYEYDAIHQLTAVHDARGSTEFTYDEIQNLVRREIFADVEDRPTGEFGYGEDGAGPNAITRADGKTYSYDAAGQMERYNGYDLLWDGEGRLVEAYNAVTERRLVQHYDDAGERRIAITYRPGKDADGSLKTVTEVHRFVAPDYQIRDGEEWWFSGAGSVGVEIVKSQGVKVDLALLDQLSGYVDGTQAKPKPLPEEYMDLARDGGGFGAGDLALAEEGFREEKRVGGERTVWRYVTTDHLGGTTHVTDSAGEFVSNQRFHPYGKVASRRGIVPQRGGYLGKDIEADRELGLLRVGMRYYAPDLGRWVTADPLIGEEPELMAARIIESGLYGYSGNNPISWKDVSGFAKTRAVAVVVGDPDDDHLKNLNSFAERNYGRPDGPPKVVKVAGATEKRRVVNGFSGDARNHHIADIMKAAKSLKNVSADQKSVTLLVHGGNSGIGHGNNSKNWLTTGTLKEVKGFRVTLAKALKTLAAVEKDANRTQEQLEAATNAVNKLYASDSYQLSKTFDDAAAALKDSGVGSVGLAGCIVGANQEYMTLMKELLSTGGHTVEVRGFAGLVEFRQVDGKAPEVGIEGQKNSFSSTSFPEPTHGTDVPKAK